MGDINFDLLKHPPKIWLDCLETFNLSRFITQPTRVTENSSTLIDHIYTNKPETIIEVNVPFYSISDNYIVCAKRKCIKQERKYHHLTINYRDFKNVDDEKFINSIIDSNISNVKNKTDVNEALILWNQLFLDCFDKHAPLKSKRVKSASLPPWINPGINQARKKRDMFHKLKDFNQYKFWRNKVNTLINDSKQVYYQNAIKEKQKSGTIWKHLNELNKGKRTNNYPSKLKVNNETLSLGDAIANNFNEFFTNIYKNLPNNSESTNLDKLQIL